MQGVSVLPLQDASFSHGEHGLPLHQPAVDTLARRQTPERDGQERHIVGRIRSVPRGQAGDGLDHEAQNLGDEGPAARGGEAAVGAAGDKGRKSRRKAGLGRDGQITSHSCALCQPRGTFTESETDPDQGLLQARGHPWRQTLEGRGPKVATDRLDCWKALAGPEHADQAMCTGWGATPPAWHISSGSIPCWATSRGRSPEAIARSVLIIPSKAPTVRTQPTDGQ